MHFDGKNKVEFLEECENLFKGRYTDQDSIFMNYMNKPDVVPPVLEAQQTSQHGNRGYSSQDRNYNR